MREMKDSGVEWIGEIPIDWDYLRIKYNFYLKGRIGWQGLKADEFIDAGPYLITGTDFQNGRVNWETCYHISDERYIEAPEIHVTIDDLLITKDGTVGKVAYIEAVPDKASLNSHILLIRSKADLVANKYLFWVLQSPMFDIYNGLAQNGTIMASLSQEKISYFSFVIPELHQQHRIADYLDATCAQIDRAIARQQEVIEKLKEYKLSVITEAVTKGLNPDVPMKDSGIEWIGEIPEHWEVKKMARLIDQTQNGLTRRDLSESTGQIVLKLKNITAEGQIDFSDCNRIELTESEKSKYILEEGDFLFVRVNGSQSLVGKCAVFYGFSEACAYNDHIIRVQLGKDCHREYVHWFFQSESGKREVELHINTAAGQYTISGIGLRNIKIIVPPIEEQIAIDNHLAKTCDKIESLIVRKRGLIDKLTEYKKSLIYEVVTGKREV